MSARPRIAPPRVALIGFGEVGRILAADLSAHGIRDIAAWDLLFAQRDSIPAPAVVPTTVRAAASAAQAVSGAGLVICAVTAAQDLDAANAAAPALRGGAFFLDLNSVSPGIRKQAARCVESHGARYVEAAVMAAIGPRRIATSMLLGGPHAAAFLDFGRGLGFSGAQVFSGEVGPASAAKMCRSIIVKGMEALVAESLLTARRHGVERAVLDSLRDLFPGGDWHSQVRYMISRSLVHGSRRAEEMREAANTVAAAGLDPWMSTACAHRQEWAAGRREAADCEQLGELLDCVLATAGGHCA